MKQLSFDTSGDNLNVAVFESGRVLTHFECNVSKQHGEHLLPVIQEVIQGVGWKPEDLDEIYVGRGPGSYTGLRIGITMAKVWAKMMNCKLYTYSSLSLMASQVCTFDVKTLLIPMIDARRGSVYVGAYQWNKHIYQNVMKDVHQDWQDWINQQLIPYLANNQIENLVFVNLVDRELLEMVENRLESSSYKIHTVLEPRSWPNTIHTFQVECSREKDVDLLVPYYAHASLAEQEWAERNRGEVNQDEGYIEYSYESDFP
ncbi:tRNA (adenosine(37)-N6)-threonylcarbamoyltransferase complex dimerization subunit type 1 TsaB [Facklamia lactis]|uniref:tRNA (adenosine(37)-N6)-threonylcarbamoyltransferase complex dimerization subunit type 1 TsaB n=1 Tax=Facklamia lactis TaxID=2749967 RepID=UPI0018CE3664|nr:tRNA (adenosine(37)-N6)-threonylcarbamoyltransferase complex dimerization subunit type 1 TsaB [Facklamia lactis]MBG9980739.1 tRNA (adenosine(37)-N6)-threonylcarbamoyltransferase complex dimerization subunit type 1 TsaB [Facklamia lactis]